MENKVKAPARAGAIAPVDVVIPAQNTGLGPEKTSFFQVINQFLLRNLAIRRLLSKCITVDPFGPITNQVLEGGFSMPKKSSVPRVPLVD